MLSFTRMDRRLRPLGFLLLNVLLSAAVTGTMLLIYDRSYRPDCDNALAITTAAASVSPIPGAVGILGVIGPGSLADEIVLLKNDGAEALVLTGWYLQKNQAKVYTFPQLTLYPGGVVELHSASGADSATDLFLGKSSAVWGAGQLVVLYDARQVARAIYRIP